ncbi:transcription antitermination protein NusB [Geofilum sp. OHC36d9]|uniref:transcription antitermination protein NusB n=1 Tax=Geofilum sp. OHC36d9 TaxID=3458413 RepID=UPI004033EA35
MLSRRLLRVKVMQMVYAFHKNGGQSVQEVEKELYHSISKSFELYHWLLLLLIDIKDYAANRIENARNKKMPSDEDLHPNTRFIDNVVIAQLADNNELNSYIEATGLSWANQPEFVRELFEVVTKSDLYKAYMEDESQSYDSQKKFVVKLVEKVIGQYEPLYQQFEEQSIYWNDESEFVVSMVIKTLKEFEKLNGSDQPLQKEFKDQEDKTFVSLLFRKSLLNGKSYTELISKFSEHWDLDRVAFMDIVLMHIALSEVLEFPLIPVRVTLNEYIEIAKHYSTPKSSVFINGMLDKIINHLTDEGKIKKIEA